MKTFFQALRVWLEFPNWSLQKKKKVDKKDKNAKKSFSS